LEGINGTNLSLVESLLEMKVSDFVLLFCKSNKSIPHKDCAFSTIDRDYKLKRFYEIDIDTDIKKDMSKVKEELSRCDQSFP